MSSVHSLIAAKFYLSTRSDMLYMLCLSWKIFLVSHHTRVWFQYRPSSTSLYNCRIACQRWCMNSAKISKISAGGLYMMRPWNGLYFRYSLVASRWIMSRLPTLRKSTSQVIITNSSVSNAPMEMVEELPATEKRSVDMSDALTNVRGDVPSSWRDDSV